MANVTTDVATAAPPQGKGLPLKVKLGFGFGDFGQGIYSVLTGLFLNAFLLNVVGLRPSLVGLIFGISLLWDGITDPLIGTLTDRTVTRWGRKRPWLLFGAIPFGVSYVMLWLSPDFGEVGTFVYFVIAALFWKTAFTAVSVPYSSLTPDLTRDYDEQTNLNSYRFRFSIIGSLIGAGLHPVIVNAAPDIELGYIFSALTWAFFMIMSTWVTFATTYELPIDKDAKHKQRGIIENLRLTAQNRPYLIVTALYFLLWLPLQLIQNYIFLYLTYWLDAANLVNTLLVVLQGTAFVMMIVWVALGRRFAFIDKKMIYYIGVIIWSVTLFFLFFLQPGQTPLIYIAGFLAGIGISVAYLVPYSLLPDVIDYGEWITGVRIEAFYYGIFIFLQKLGLSLSIAVSNFVLDIVGYINPTEVGAVVVQPDSVLLTLRLLVSWAPMIVLILGIPLMMAYPITREKLREVQAQLGERNLKLDGDAQA